MSSNIELTLSYFFQWDMVVHNTLYRVPWKILQIFQPARKCPARRLFGWRIGFGNPSARPVSFQFLGNWFFWRIFSGWNISQCISFSRNADRQGVCGVAERSEGKKGVSACRYRYGKNNRSNFKKLLFFQWKRPVLFFKDLVLFRKEQDVFIERTRAF